MNSKTMVNRINISTNTYIILFITESDKLHLVRKCKYRRESFNQIEFQQINQKRFLSPMQTKHSAPRVNRNEHGLSRMPSLGCNSEKDNYPNIMNLCQPSTWSRVIAPSERGVDLPSPRKQHVWRHRCPKTPE